MRLYEDKIARIVSEERFKKFEEKRKNVEKDVMRLKEKTIKPTDEVNKILAQNGSSIIDNGIKLSELLKRTELTYENL